MSKFTKEDIEEVMSQEGVKACCEAVKKSNKNYSPKEMSAFRFGVASTAGGIDEIVNQFGIVFDEYEFEDDDVKLITAAVEKKLMEVA